jgi:hypothetical protein
VNRVAIQRAIRAERAGRVASKSSVLLRRLLTRRVDCSKDLAMTRAMSHVRRATIQKAPAKRIVPTPSLNVNINENDSHYNYRQVKITLQKSFFTAS